MAQAPLYATNYLLEKTYTDRVHNPTPSPDQIPSQQLRNMYQQNKVHPISVALFLAYQGVVTVAKFAIQFGETEEKAREMLDLAAGGGPLSNLWSQAPLARDGPPGAVTRGAKGAS